MADTVPVSNADELVDAVVDREYVDVGESVLYEAWDIWSARTTEMGLDEKLVIVPEWFSENDFGARRPVFFAKIEYDDTSSKAILFSEATAIDISILEGGYWDQVSMSEATEVIDVSIESDYIDDAGKLWCPRSLITIVER